MAKYTERLANCIVSLIEAVRLIIILLPKSVIR